MVFGIIAVLDPDAGVVVFCCTLFFLACMEEAFSELKFESIRRGYEKLFEKLENELLQLGVVSFILFMLNSAGTTVPFEYYLAFEFTHIVMMFVAIAFITQAAFLVRYAVKENRNVVIAMREDLSELIFRYHMFQENANIFSKLAFTTFPGWFPFIPELRSNMETYIAKLGEVSKVNWIFLGFLAVLNYIRVVAVDPNLRSRICGGTGLPMLNQTAHSESSSTVSHMMRYLVAANEVNDFERRLSGATTSDTAATPHPLCVDYFFAYDAFCAVALSVFILLLNMAASRTYHEIIKLALKDKEKRFGQREVKVSPNMVTPVDGSKSKDLKKGSRVEANYLGKSTWLPGSITKIYDDGTMDILYDPFVLDGQIVVEDIDLTRTGYIKALEKIAMKSILVDDSGCGLVDLADISKSSAATKFSAAANNLSTDLLSKMTETQADGGDDSINSVLGTTPTLRFPLHGPTTSLANLLGPLATLLPSLPADAIINDGASGDSTEAPDTAAKEIVMGVEMVEAVDTAHVNESAEADPQGVKISPTVAATLTAGVENALENTQGHVDLPPTHDTGSSLFSPTSLFNSINLPLPQLAIDQASSNQSSNQDSSWPLHWNDIFMSLTPRVSDSTALSSATPNVLGGSRDNDTADFGISLKQEPGGTDGAGATTASIATSTSSNAVKPLGPGDVIVIESKLNYSAGRAMAERIAQEDRHHQHLRTMHATNGGILSVGRKPKKKKAMQVEEIQSIFLAGRSGPFFRAVELALFLQCTYIAIAFTQFLPIALAHGRGGWFFGFFFLVLVNYYVLRGVIHKAVQIKAVAEVNKEVYLLVCEECEIERESLGIFRARIVEHLQQNNIPEDEWQDAIREIFEEHDTDGNTELDRDEFNKFLYDLEIFMSEHSFKLLWHAVDYDRSNSISWDEIVAIVYPEKATELRMQRIVIKKLRDVIVRRARLGNVKQQLAYVKELFDELDIDKTGALEKDEFVFMIRKMKVTMSYAAIDHFFEGMATIDENSGSRVIQWLQFADMIFPTTTSEYAGHTNPKPATNAGMATTGTTADSEEGKEGGAIGDEPKSP